MLEKDEARAYGYFAEAARLAQARAVMDQIDEKYKTKEEEQYLDPDKGFAELRDPTAPRPIADDKDAIKSFKGDFAFLAPDARLAPDG